MNTSTSGRRTGGAPTRTVPAGPPPSMAFVSTFPPTACGIATFTASLITAITDHRGGDKGLSVVRLVDQATARAEPEHGPSVRLHVRGDTASLARTRRVLDAHDVVSIQHEFGIYAGEDGEEATDLIDGLSVPAIVTFHTVLQDPSRRQRSIVSHLAARSARSVVMSDAAALRLTTHYGVQPAKIEVVPHGYDPRLSGVQSPGATPPTDATPPTNGTTAANETRPLALTWGLIGPGKGLETAIEATAALLDVRPLPRYLIAGATHPGVLAHSGEAYRQQLLELVADLGVGGIVEFDNRYLDTLTLHDLVRSADLVVLPYLSTEQVTSGVLIEAVGAGRPVVATAFPHAVEVLASGAGTVVPRQDPRALAGAIRAIVTNPAAAERMSRAARSVARSWTWPVIGARFDAVVRAVAHPGFTRLRVGRPDTGHLRIGRIDG